MIRLYPFGMTIPGRTFSGGMAYRYGFNGKEQDKDINSLAAYDYGFRIYNPAIGKFISVDPLTNKYTMLTPYQFAANMPTIAIDVDGEEAKIKLIYHSEFGDRTIFTVQTDKLFLVDDKKTQSQIFVQDLIPSWPTSNQQAYWEVYNFGCS